MARLRSKTCFTVSLRVADTERPLRVEVRPLARSRHLRLRVKTADEVSITAPMGVSADAVIAFLEGHKAWIVEQWGRLQPPVALRAFLLEHPFLTVRGERWPFFWEVEAGPVPRVILNKRAREVRLTFPDQSAFESDLFWQKGLRKIAAEVLDLRVCDLAERIGRSIPPVSVRDQSTRWGSCAGSGRISLNWRLVFLAPELQDYVIYHELAHLTEMNHSPRFWDLLHTYDPRAGRHDKRLTLEGRAIIQLGVRG